MLLLTAAGFFLSAAGMRKYCWLCAYLLRPAKLGFQGAVHLLSKQIPLWVNVASCLVHSQRGFFSMSREEKNSLPERFLCPGNKYMGIFYIWRVFEVPSRVENAILPLEQSTPFR